MKCVFSSKKAVDETGDRREDFQRVCQNHGSFRHRHHDLEPQDFLECWCVVTTPWPLTNVLSMCWKSATTSATETLTQTLSCNCRLPVKSRMATTASRGSVAKGTTAFSSSSSTMPAAWRTSPSKYVVVEPMAPPRQFWCAEEDCEPVFGCAQECRAIIIIVRHIGFQRRSRRRGCRPVEIGHIFLDEDGENKLVDARKSCAIHYHESFLSHGLEAQGNMRQQKLRRVSCKRSAWKPVWCARCFCGRPDQQ